MFRNSHFRCEFKNIVTDVVIVVLRLGIIFFFYRCPFSKTVLDDMLLQDQCFYMIFHWNRELTWIC